MSKLDPRAIEIAAKWLSDKAKLAEVFYHMPREDCPLVLCASLPPEVATTTCGQQEENGWDCGECIALLLIAAHRRAVEQARKDDEPHGPRTREEAMENMSLIAGVTDVLRGRKPVPRAVEEGGPA